MAYAPKKKTKTASEKPQQEFAKGVSVKVQETKFGDIIKVGLNVEEIMENPINDEGFINIEIKKSKAGKMFATVQKPLDN